MDDEFETAGTGTTTLQLVMVSPSGSASFTNLPNSLSTSGYGQSLGNVIPDGNGGVLAATVNNSQGQTMQTIADIGGSGATATLSSLSSGAKLDMVLGDQGAYFSTDGNQVVAVNEDSGGQVWSWQPNSGTVEIIAATAGGGVAVRNILSPGQEDVVRLDSTGAPTYDSWGTAGGLQRPLLRSIPPIANVHLEPTIARQSVCNHLTRTTRYFHVFKTPSVLSKSLNAGSREDSNPTLSAILLGAREP